MTSSGAYQLIMAVSLTITGCTGMKNISTEDPLYIGYKIEFKGPFRESKKLSTAVWDVMKPRPNNKFLWMRPAVARFNMVSSSGINRNKKKLWWMAVTQPILLSQTRQTEVIAAIQNRIFHSGYFNNDIRLDTVKIGKRKVRYTYLITLSEPYRLDSIVFPDADNDLAQTILRSQTGSLLKAGDIYTLDALKSERIRIDRNLKEHGYIYFNPEFIKINADSITGDHKLNIELILKPETPLESRTPYTIGKIFIVDDNLDENRVTDTLKVDNYYLISQENELTFDALQQGIFLKQGDLYTNSNVMHTVRYLTELPIIRNASLKFTPGGGKQNLDAVLYLSQRNRLAYSAEFNTIFRSTNYFGPGVVFSYTDHNVNRGAEMLKVNLRGRFEMQIAEGQINPAYEMGVELNYMLPRFYPKFLFGLGRKRLPKTNISAGYNLFNRLDLYRMNSVFANFGYLWSRTDYISHAFNLAEIIFTKIPANSKSDEFNNYLEANPGVQRSFDEQFIVGTGYEFTVNSSKRRNQRFLKVGIDVAGNLVNGLYSAADASKDSLGRYKLLGVPFSQYARGKIDVRYSFNSNRSTLVTRFIAGVGIPLINSIALPYIKQFYVGGTNSLRSFVARSIGPGSETPPEGYNDLTGDIRLEWNIEYRFGLSGQLQGALFIDAGNVWLVNMDKSRPNGTFHFNTFFEEIAMSTGWGLRWDFDFIVARVDFAYTLYTPYLSSGERWAGDYKFFKPTVNIAIGYPF